MLVPRGACSSTLPETNSSQLRWTVGIRYSFLLGQKAYFQGLLLLVLGSVDMKTSTKTGV